MTARRTLYDKLFDAHVVRAEAQDAPAIIFVDLHLLHEVTSPQAFAELGARELEVAHPELTFATLDHGVPTLPADENGERPYVSPESRLQVEELRKNAARHGVRLADFDTGRRGVVHVVAPELGLLEPGMTVVCGDSHTSTLGAFACLAFGIGTSEVAHVLATQSLLQRRARTMRVTVDGRLPPGVSAKDLALAIIAAVGAGGATGYAIEFAGEAVAALSMEGRMTVCNMAVECGARTGLVAADETTFAWLEARSSTPPRVLEVLRRRGLTWRSHAGARFDAEVRLDASGIEPMVTWGTTPDTAQSISTSIPAPRRDLDRRAAEYMGVQPGDALMGLPVDVVFVGSCSNGRLVDLREAAAVLRGRKVRDGVRMLVVPGSEAVRAAAEREGLDKVFLAAGAEWRLAGCSMCLAMNGDLVEPGQRVVSTSNRNFEGRQGPGSRTVLASPATAAASAIAGALADPRTYLGDHLAH